MQQTPPKARTKRGRAGFGTGDDIMNRFYDHTMRQAVAHEQFIRENHCCNARPINRSV